MEPERNGGACLVLVSDLWTLILPHTLTKMGQYKSLLARLLPTPQLICASSLPILPSQTYFRSPRPYCCGDMSTTGCQDSRCNRRNQGIVCRAGCPDNGVQAAPIWWDYQDP